MKKNSDNSPKTELRRQAEAKLSERKKKAASRPVTELETQRLIHELEVHQIELEMQNEELVQSRAQVEAGLQQYTNLYDFAPIGYFTLASDGTIHQVNLTGASLLGIERSALIKRRFGTFVSTESRSVFNAFLEKVFGSQQKGTCEVTFQNNGSAPLWVHIEATSSAVSHGEREACRVVVVDIAERKHAEELQNETERVKSGLLEKLNEAQHFAMIGNWEWNMQTNHVWWSDETYRIFGVTPQDYVPSFEANGKFIHPDDFEKYNKSFEHSFQTGEPLDFDTRLVANDGLLKYCNAKGKILYDDSSKPIRFIGTIMDITERKRAEEALQESENEFRLLAESMPQIVWITRSDGWNIYFNQQWVDYTGLTLEESYGHSWNKPFHPDDQQRAWDAWQDATKNGTIYSLECRLRRSDGIYKWWLIRGVPVLDAHGTILKWFGTCTDINEIKQAEEELKKSEEKFRAVAELSPMAIYSSSGSDKKAIYINKAFYKIFGFSMEDVPTVEHWWIKAFPDEKYRKQIFDQWVYNIDQTAKNNMDVKALECVCTCKDGSEKIIVWVGKTIGDEFWAFGYDITERKRVEEVLHASEEKYRSIFENIQDVYYETLLDGKILEVSPSIELMSKGQYRRVDLIGKSMFDFYQDINNRHAIIAAMQKKGSVADFEVQLKNRDGSLINCSISAKLSFNVKGQPEKIIGSMHDISERKKAEENLRDSQVLYHSLVEQLPAGVFRKDLEGRYIFVSSWFCRLKNMKPEELLGKTPNEVAAYEAAKDNMTERSIKYAAQGEDHHKLIIQTGKPIELDEEYTNADGTKQFVHTIKIPVFNSDEKIVGTQGILFDITELNRAEEDIRKLSNAVEQSGSSIVITNLKGDIEYVNPKVVELTGYSIQEVVGKNPRIMKSGKTSNEEYKHLWDTITNGQVWRGEFHNKKKNGELYWESATISPIKDADGKTTHFLAVKEDITQQKTMAEELRQMQKLEGLGTLAGGIAHDFNNILGIILAYNSGIKKFKDDSKKLELATETITKAVDRGKTLVQQILMFARKTEISFGAVNVNNVVMETVTMVMETFPKFISCSQNFDKSISYINADRSQLHQVLMNLCVNARDAMPKGGVLAINTRMVSVASLRHQHPDAAASSYVCIEVCDTGEGMSEEIRKRIFEPFFTTKGIGKGTGLGLSVTFGVIQTHKGFIDVESELGKGTTFRFYLPASQVAEPIRVTEEKTLEEMPGGTETLLVVEDEEMLLMSLQMVLVDKGYKVIAAKDGLKALEIYHEKKNDIALVITDLGLPNITGLEVCQKIKKINPNERMILATGFLDPDMKAEFLKAGIQHFLYKPYDLRQVLKEVREVLDKK